MRYLLASVVVLVAFWLRLHDLYHAPPGLSFDEMANGVDALRFAQGYGFPLFDDPNRPEPLYRIFAGIMLALGGYTTFVLRMTSVFFGVLAIAGAYRATLEAVRVSRRQAAFEYPAALFGASVLAVTISHIALSRVTYRALPLPLFASLFAFCLFRAARTGRQAYFALAGLWLGLAWESYTAGIALTAMAVLFVMHQLIFAPRRLLREWRGLLSMGAVFLATASPLIYRMLTAPHTVIGHASEVAGAPTVQNLFYRYSRTWGMLHAVGDVNPQYNVWSDPLIPEYYPLFLLGLAVCLLRIRRLSAAWCLVWPLVALTPVALSNEMPHGLRVIMIFAAFPPVLGFAVDGLLIAVRWLVAAIGRITGALGKAVAHVRRGVLPEQWPSSQALNLALCMVALVPLIRAPGIEERYLAYWDADFKWHVYGRDMRHSDWFFRTAQVEIAHFISGLDEPVYLPIDELDWQTTRFHLAPDFPHVRAFDGEELPPGYVVIPFDLARDGLMDDVAQYVLLEPGGGTMTLLPPVTEDSLARIRQTLTADGEPFYRADGSELLGEYFELARPDQVFELSYPPPNEVYTDFGGDMALIGWSGPTDLESGRDLTFRLYWRALRDMGRDRWVFAQLWDHEGNRWAGDDVQVWRWLYPTGMWRPGDVVVDRHVFAMPEDAPWGVYYLVVGVYEVTGERLPAQDESGIPLGEYVPVAALRIPQPEPPDPADASHEFEGRLGDSVALAGFDVEPEEGGLLTVRLYWQALERMADSYTIFLHLQDASGELVAQSDTLPFGGRYPTTVWMPGETVATEHVLTIPDSATPPFTLYVGMYPWPSMERLPAAQDGEIRPDSRLELITFGSG